MHNTLDLASLKKMSGPLLLFFINAQNSLGTNIIDAKIGGVIM